MIPQVTRWRATWAIVALLAAVLAAGCDPAQNREWTIRASRIEIGLINSSAFMPATARLTDDQVQALAEARVGFYEFYGEAAKAAIDGLKD